MRMKRGLNILVIIVFSAFAAGLPHAVHLHIEHHKQSEGDSGHPSHDSDICTLCQAVFAAAQAELPSVLAFAIKPDSWFKHIEPTAALPCRLNPSLPAVPRAPPDLPPTDLALL